MTDGNEAGVPYGRRLTDLARERADDTAVIFVADDGTEVRWSWRQLDERANQMAQLFAARHVDEGDVVVIGLANTPEHVAATFAAWKLGASVLPLRSDLPAWERDRLLGTVEPRLVAADWPGALTSAELATGAELGTRPPPVDRLPRAARLVASSGSTGSPKIIVAPSPALYVHTEETPGGFGGDAMRVTLCASPLYHTNGQLCCFPPLLRGCQVVLMEHFDAARAVDLIERHRVTMTILVPTMLQRIARLDGVRGRDFSSLEQVSYGGASLPEWAARVWLQLIPPERFLFVYGGSERLGSTVCTGKEWLDRPGTVGRAVDCDIAILDGDRQPLPAGEVGEIWMRLNSDEPPFEYIGVPTPEPIRGGYRTFGDMGWLDAEGFLYIADRRQDMIVTGGVNVFPAEVEAALSSHPGVADVVVVGLPDPEWGHRVHAIVQPSNPDRPPSGESLRAFAKERLTGPKVPKTFEILAALPRTAAGKINRSKLAEERAAER